MNFQPPEEDDPRDDDQRMQDAESAAPQGVASEGFAKALCAYAAEEQCVNAETHWHVYESLYRKQASRILHHYRAALAQAGQAAPAGEVASKGACQIRYLGGLRSTWACDKCGYRDAHDMILFCPKCGAQHVDKPDALNDAALILDNEPMPPMRLTLKRWTNPPHRSHLCHSCGHIWRPSDVHTNGVAEISSKGVNDSTPPIRGIIL